jgi:adenine-specific DNA-methyltransferase
MSTRTRRVSPPDVADYRYDTAKRKNNPPAGLAAQGRIQEKPKDRYSYNPHLPPVLRFDQTGATDRLPELLEEAKRRPLSSDEVELLAEALRTQEPWLEWSGKRESREFEVDPVALHIHERVSTKAILAAAKRQDIQRSFFADPELDYAQAVRFYQHEVDWANRLILGDSLQVMNSLANREGLAGKVQMIYVDPPYGIKFASNFQPAVGRTAVTDRPSDLTREPEQIRAYRDTWSLGVHTYLDYLRDRLILSRTLLKDSGSIFVQISDENLGLIRVIMDEVFGPGNFVALITFQKTSSFPGRVLAAPFDYILWYARDREHVKYRQLLRDKIIGEAGTDQYTYVREANGWVRSLKGIATETAQDNDGFAPLRPDNLTSDGGGAESARIFRFAGQEFDVGPRHHWKTTPDGLARLAKAERVMVIGRMPYYIRFLADFPAMPISNVWIDTGLSGFAESKVYVVQTNPKVIERCMLMTTDPGDLVLDPTSGSGTTAYVAEQWGRRWIATDTSRVANAVARQRLLTASYPFFELQDPEEGVAGGFVLRTVSHIMLKNIAQNTALDPIFARHESILHERLANLNSALEAIGPDIRQSLRRRLSDKERSEGKRSITDADRRRWLLPEGRWEEWNVPFESDPLWPEPLRSALADYRLAWREKIDEVNATISASTAQERMVDQPRVNKGIVRVSGPFTVESVLPIETQLADSPGPIEVFNGELEAFHTDGVVDIDLDPQNLEAFIERIIRLLRQDGARFFDNKTVKFERLDPLENELLHAEGEWSLGEGEPRRVAVSVGPSNGNVPAKQVEDCLRAAYRRGFDDVIFAGLGFDAAAQAAIQEDANPNVRAHLAYIRPDIMMGDLLKETPNSQIFTILGLPRTRLENRDHGEFTVVMEGVDIYDPVENTVRSTSMDKVAAWFVDSDYDGRTFCICQAFFPDRSAWNKIARALKSVIEPEAFEKLSGTESLPFRIGPNGRVAVKVIDPRGSEVMAIHDLTPDASYGSRLRD